MFNNLMASRPAGERRWTVWLVAAAVHVLVVFVIAVLMDRSDADETIEIFSEPILLEDAPLPPITPLPEIKVKPPATTASGTDPGRAPLR